MHTFVLRRLAAAALLCASPFAASAATGTDFYQFLDGKVNNAGSKPVGTLLVDKAGDVIGNTMWGGAADAGTIYEMTQAADGTWTHTTAWQYSAMDEAGAEPVAGLVLGPDGAFYGTTTLGTPNGVGGVFRFAKAAGGKWSTQLLHSFDRDTEGSTPTGELAFDASGNLWGTLSQGGANGQGSIFKLAKKGTSAVYTTAWQFAGAPTDGAAPTGHIAIDAAGTVYGTTKGGGAYGLGTVWSLTPSKKASTLAVLFSFRGDNGMFPLGGISIDAKGDLFGTASGGAGTGGGVVFEMTPDAGAYDYAVLHAFAGGTEGWASSAPVTIGAKGQVFGTTEYGGSGSVSGGGTVFELVQAKDGSWTYSTLFASTSSLDSIPFGVALGADGKSLFTSQTYGDGINWIPGGWRGNLLEVTP